jgi:PAS domain S-box-containing protein
MVLVITRYGGALRIRGAIHYVERYLVLPNSTGSSWIATLGAAGSIAVAYFLAARLGLALRPLPAHMAVFWPATGIATGILIIAGRRAGLAVVLGVMAGSVAAIVLNQRGFLASIFLGASNVGEVVLLAWLLSRWCDRPLAFRDLREVLGFLSAAGIAAAISGIGGAATLAFYVAPYQVVWETWVPSHAVGIVVVAPLLIALDQIRRHPPSQGEAVEVLSALAILLLATLYAVCQPTKSWLTFSETLVMLPPLFWLAARYQPAFAITGASIASSAVICATTFGIGRFGDAAVPTMDRVHGAQAIVMTLMVSTLILTALFAELKRGYELLRIKEASFRRLLDALPAAIQTTDTAGRITYCNQAAVDLWGARPALGRDTRYDLYRLYYPDGAPMPDDEQPCQVSLTEKRRVLGQDALLERPDGQRIPIIPCPSPLFDEAGKFIGIVNMHLDITERKRAEAKLAEREAQLALFVEHAPAAIAMFDCDMRYLAVSRRFITDFRLSPSAQLIGRSHYEIFPDIPQRWRDIHSRVLAGEELSDDADQFTRQDGRTEWMRWSMAPWRGGDGRIGGAMLFSEVRTEQLETRRALIESEARFRGTFENAAVGVALVGPDGSFQRVNNSLTRMLGYSAEELKTKTFREITHPDDLEANLSVLNKTLIGEAVSYSIEKRYIRKDGGAVWANLTVGCVRKADGTVDYLISVIQDISDRKQAEARLAERNAQFDLAHKAARVGCYTHDISARTMRFSRASLAPDGPSRSMMEVTAQQWCARVHRDDMERLRAEHIRAFKERRGELVSEFRFVRPGGEARWIEARSLIIYNQAGRVERMTGVYIDVTERRKAEDHKNLLIAELDHRVKNVLACVAAVAQRSRECSRSADEFLGMLNGRINSLANTHVLLSRSHWKGVDLRELVHSELAFCTKDESALIEGPEVDLAPEATQPVAMVLHELATNASKYGALSNCHGRVLVRWRRPSNDGTSGKLLLEWRETGGPLVAASNSPGYGTSVIRDLIPYELGGTVDYDLARDGIRCTIEIPAEWLSNCSRARGALNGSTGRAHAIS